MRITASYKTLAYKKRFKFNQYGINVVIVQYSDAINHKAGKVADVIMRYFHLNKICVENGELVTKDTKIGDYGNTGKYSAGAHLPLGVGSDVSAPTHTLTLEENSSLLCCTRLDSSGPI